MQPGRGKKPSGCAVHMFASIRILKHELILMKAEAESYDLSLCRYLSMVWRHWRSLGVPLVVIPPLPVDPYVPSSLSKKPAA